jgi:hypothetical protein
MGAFSAMVAKTVSKGQETFKLESQFFVAGRVGLENFKSLLDMVDAFKKDPKNGKKTVMVIPGATKVYASLDKAKAYLAEPFESSDKLISVIFKFQGWAFDVVKFLGDDPAA